MGQTGVGLITLTDFIDQTAPFIENAGNQINIAAFSFGGMTATALAGKYSEKINKLIYIDAFVPAPGQSFAIIAGEKITRQIKAYAHVMGEDEMIPPFFETDPRYRSHPLHTLFSHVDYDTHILDRLKPVYIECTSKDPRWAFTPLLARTAADMRDRQWDCYELNSDHMPMYSHSAELFRIMMKFL